MNIAIIGAGKVGRALGGRLVASGLDVTFGLKDGADASGLAARSAPAAEAARLADVVFLAVPGDVAVAVARTLPLAGKVVVDCNNPVRWDAGPVWTPPPQGSLAAAIAHAAPGARVVKAFNQFGAEFHANPTLGATTADVYLAGDDAEAKQTVSSIAATAGFTPIDAGPLRNAAVLENLATLWIHLATVGGQGREVAFKLLHR
jgi:predicted dinucleotide-binding enzyme